MTKKQLLEALEGLEDTAEVYVYGVGNGKRGTYANDVYFDDKEMEVGNNSITIIAHL